MYRNYFTNDIQPTNLAKLTEQYIWRTAIDMQRENNIIERGDTKTLKVRMLESIEIYYWPGPGNTKGGSITVPLTSCLTGLESAV
jgi:hypothetical protein